MRLMWAKIFMSTNYDNGIIGIELAQLGMMVNGQWYYNNI